MSGGFLEPCASTAVRPRPAVPLPTRGPFRFPEPYDTLGVRITNADDGPVLPTAYSYWQGINAHAGQPGLLVFLGVDRQRGGGGPSLWGVHKTTHEVTPLGPLFPPEHPLSWSTGEGWYWSATEPYILYASDLEHLYRVNVRGPEFAIEAVVDISTPALKAFGCVLWQWHSAADGQRHSATVKRIAEDYKPIGCIVYPWRWFPASGALDECQIDKSGQWLLIKENVDGQDGEDNRIVNLANGCERILTDRQGAAGHSDSGFGYMVAADNWNDKAGALRLWMFDGSEPQGRLVYFSPTWDVELNHISHGNAQPGVPDGQWVLGSGATRNIGPRANELVMVPLDGSLMVRVIAPTMGDLDAPGGGDDYGKYPKANLDTSGEWALWTSNHGSDRLDAFLVKIPR